MKEGLREEVISCQRTKLGRTDLEAFHLDQINHLLALLALLEICVNRSFISLFRIQGRRGRGEIKGGDVREIIAKGEGKKRRLSKRSR